MERHRKYRGITSSKTSEYWEWNWSTAALACMPMWFHLLSMGCCGVYTAMMLPLVVFPSMHSLYLAAGPSSAVTANPSLSFFPKLWYFPYYLSIYWKHYRDPNRISEIISSGMVITAPCPHTLLLWSFQPEAKQHNKIQFSKVIWAPKVPMTFSADKNLQGGISNILSSFSVSPQGGKAIKVQR